MINIKVQLYSQGQIETLVTPNGPRASMHTDVHTMSWDGRSQRH